MFENYLRKSTQEIPKSDFSPESIRNKLIAYYKSELKIQRLFYREISIENYAVDLAILKGSDQLEKLNKFNQLTQTDQNTLMEQADRQDCLERSTALWGDQGANRIPYSSLLNFFPDKEKKILIVGAAGAGKTTLSRQLLNKWSQGQPAKTYSWVFRIELGNLTEENYCDEKEGKQYNALDIFYRECIFPLFNEDILEDAKNALYEYLAEKEKSGEILWILDGYDELSEAIPISVAKSLHKILSETKQIILTSRPYNLDAFFLENESFSPEVQLEITGFSPIEIENYVRKLFSSPAEKQDGEKLLHFINNNLNIAGVCRIPINLELVCYVWKVQPMENRLFSMSQLYYEVVVALCFRYLKKSALIKNVNNLPDSEVLSHCGEPLAFLDYFAFAMIDKKELVLKTDKVNIYINHCLPSEKKKSLSAHQEQQKALGLIKPNNQGSGQDGRVPYYFVHLMLRDFFVARYLCAVIQSQLLTPQIDKLSFFPHQWLDECLGIEDYIIAHRYDSYFQVVWWFVVGLLAIKEDKYSLFWFLGIILRKERSDLTTLQTANLLLRCLDETNKQFNEFPDLLREQLLQPVKQWASILIRRSSRFQDSYNTSVHSFWESLKISRWIFQHKQIQDFFVKSLESCDQILSKKTSESLNQIRQYTPVIFNTLLNLMVKGKQLSVDLSTFFLRLLDALKKEEIRGENALLTAINFINSSVKFLGLSSNPESIESYLDIFYAALLPLKETVLDDQLFVVIQTITTGIFLHKIQKGLLPLPNKLEEISVLNGNTDKKEHLFVRSSEKITTLGNILVFFIEQMNCFRKIKKGNSLSDIENLWLQLWKKLIQSFEDENSSLSVFKQCINQIIRIVKKVLDLLSNPLNDLDDINLKKVLNIQDFEKKLLTHIKQEIIVKRYASLFAIIEMINIHNNLTDKLKIDLDIEEKFSLLISLVENNFVKNEIAQIHLENFKEKFIQGVGVLLLLKFRQIFKVKKGKKIKLGKTSIKKTVDSMMDKQLLKAIDYINLSSSRVETEQLACISAWFDIIEDLSRYEIGASNLKKYQSILDKLKMREIIRQFFDFVGRTKSDVLKVSVVNRIGRLLVFHFDPSLKKPVVGLSMGEWLAALLNCIKFDESPVVYGAAINHLKVTLGNPINATALEQYFFSDTFLVDIPSYDMAFKQCNVSLIKINRIHFLEGWFSVITELVVKTGTIRLFNKRQNAAFVEEISNSLEDEDINVKLAALHFFHRQIAKNRFLIGMKLDPIETWIKIIKKLNDTEADKPLVLINTISILRNILPQMSVLKNYFLSSFDDTPYYRNQLIVTINNLGFSEDINVLNEKSSDELQAIAALTLIPSIDSSYVLNLVLKSIGMDNQTPNILLLSLFLRTIPLKILFFEIAKKFDDPSVKDEKGFQNSINAIFHIVIRRLIQSGKAVYFVDDTLYFYEGKQYNKINFPQKNFFIAKFSEIFEQLTETSLKTIFSDELYSALKKEGDLIEKRLKRILESPSQKLANQPTLFGSTQTMHIDRLEQNNHFHNEPFITPTSMADASDSGGGKPKPLITGKSTMKTENVLPFESVLTFVGLFERANRLSENERACLQILKDNLMRNFTASYPNVSQVAEFVSIVSVTVNDHIDYWEAMKTYLIFLTQRGGFIEHHYLKGLGDLLRLGDAKNSDWLKDEQKTNALFHALRNNKVLFETVGLTLSQTHDRLLLWQQICYVFEDSKLMLSEEYKQEILETLKKYKTILKETTDNEWGLVLIESVKQSLGRNNASKKSDLIRVGGHLRLALVTGSQAAVSSGLATLTFGATALAAVKPTVDTVKHLSDAAKEASRIVKKNYDKRVKGDIYLKLRELQAALWLHASEEGSNTQNFINLLQELKEVKDEKLSRILAYGLVEELRDIAMVYRRKDYAHCHQSIFELLLHYFNTTEEPILKARLADIFISIANSVSHEWFDKAVIELITVAIQEFSQWPLLESFTDNFVQLYARCREESDRHRYLRLGLLRRLETQFEKQPAVVARILQQLLKLGIDVELVNVTLDKLRLDYPKLRSTLNIQLADNQIMRCSLLLVAWYQLNEGVQKELIKALTREGFSSISVLEKKEKHSRLPGIFGTVGKLSIALVVAGVQINYPSQLKTAKEFAEFASGLGFAQNREKNIAEGIPELNESKEGFKLAQEVGEAFIGGYVSQEGLQIGFPQEALDEAAKLAREWGSEQKQIAVETSPLNDPLPSLSTPASFFSGNAKEAASLSDIPKGCFEVKAQGEGKFILLFDYDALYEFLEQDWELFYDQHIIKLNHPSLLKNETRKEDDRIVEYIFKNEKSAKTVKEKLIAKAIEMQKQKESIETTAFAI